MRVHSTVLALLTTLGLTACGGEPTYGTGDPVARDTAQLPPSAAAGGRAPAPSATPPADPATFSEVVYVLMRDRMSRRWFCTGSLVARDKVVTAAHCLDSRFVSYEIVAPLAPSKPRARAVLAAAWSTAFAEVANPDIGFLTLESPIELAQYAELADVGPRIDAGEALVAGAVVRSDELPEAPLTRSEHVPVSSTIDLGYEHGFGTPMFTKGGDSGAGLFLVEGGVLTHKLIGVARQPEPTRNLDHFTRVDAAFLGWFAEKTTAR